MKTPQRAILWELWRTGRSDLMIRLFSLSLMVVMFAVVISNSRLQSSALQPIAGITVLLLMICGAMSSLWLQELDTQQSGFSLRLGFTRPISTCWLVSLPILYGVVTSVLCYVIPASLFTAVIGTKLPVHAPILLTALMNVGCLAAMWGTRNRLEKLAGILLLSALSVGLIRWYIGVVPLGESWINQLGNSVNHSWSYLYDAIVIFAVAVMIGVTIFAVDRQRHELSGERVLSVPRDLEIDRVNESAKISLTLSFFGGLSRFAAITRVDQRLLAQAGFELRRCGLVTLIAGLLLPLIVLGLVYLIPLINPKWERQPLTWLLAIIFCPLVYQLIGVDAVAGLRGRQGRIDISPFDLIRPLRNDQMAAIKLIVVACSTLTGWLIMLGAGGCYMVVHYGTDWFVSSSQMWKGLTSVTPLIWVAGLCCLAMSIVSSSSMLLALALWMPLNPWRLVGLVWTTALNCVLVFIDAQNGLRFRTLWTVEVWVLCGLIPILSGLFLWRVWQSGSMGSRYLVSAVALWLAWAASSYWLRTQISAVISVPFEFSILAVALLPVPLVTTLTAPLAYATYRHR
jgi:hypothetical protein